MDQELLLNLTNALLGLATLALWGIVVVGVVREILNRKKRHHSKPLLYAVPNPGSSGPLFHHHVLGGSTPRRPPRSTPAR